MIGASQSALSIQNPSQAGPRTQGEGSEVAHAVAPGIALTANAGLVMARLARLLPSVSGIEPGIGLIQYLVPPLVDGGIGGGDSKASQGRWTNGLFSRDARATRTGCFQLPAETETLTDKAKRSGGVGSFDVAQDNNV